MISRRDIINWSVEHPWQEQDQIEQDLLLSQAICEIASDELLAEELALRGGTAFHKLFLEKPLRYSEDLDYVRTTAGGIGEVTGRLLDIGKRLGYTVSSKMGMYPKVLWRYIADSGLNAKIKIEINTYEREPVRGFQTPAHSVLSPYYHNTVRVRTFFTEELMATKIRALYQRAKGRDLFDLWLALTELKINAADVVDIFSAYRPPDLTSEEAIKNLRKKLDMASYVKDTANLLRNDAPVYDPIAAGEIVISNLLSAL
ncbi:MAG: nucleotidyl transferase AbiEii/AbiGii toxin family protein [Lachnospiraceae bacterium]|nr:nucleotidyl transferase AbiEii/AbiGii toxin family protein [Lachnospiraceae bacterium]